MINLNEYRGLRNAYGQKAVKALARRFHSRTLVFWEEMIEDTKRVPPGNIDGLLLFAPLFGDMAEWAAITRFCWLAEKVWELECDELADRTYPQWEAHNNAKRRRKAA